MTSRSFVAPRLVERIDDTGAYWCIKRTRKPDSHAVGFREKVGKVADRQTLAIAQLQHVAPLATPQDYVTRRNFPNGAHEE